VNSDKVDIFMPVYVADLLRDTDDLSTDEFGTYLRLLLHMWTRGGVLPDEPERLSRLAGVDRSGLDRVWPVIGKFFRASKGSLSQKRLSEELEKARLRKAAAVERARKGGIASASSATSSATSSEPQAPLQVDLESSTSPSPLPSESKTKSSASSEGNAHARALGAFCAAWQAAYGEPYKPSASDKSQLGRLLRELGDADMVSTLPELFARYLNDHDPFIAQKQRHSLAYFCTSGNGVNKYRVSAMALTDKEARGVMAGQQWVGYHEVRNGKPGP
jgi:uncharacterized protein YdaU (DUF1376 family)